MSDVADRTGSPAGRSTAQPVGIAVRHRRACGSRGGGRCSCSPSYQAQAWSARDQKMVRRSFATVAEARAWRQQAQVKLRAGQMNAPAKLLVSEAAEQFLADARAGVARTRSGHPYKPSAIRAYEAALQTLLPELGQLRLTALSRSRIQDLVDRQIRAGYAPATVRNTVLPLRAIYRRAVARELVVDNPTLGLSLPAARARRERVARPTEAEALIAALPEREQALWATALYAGLRRGELQALRWPCVDLDAGVISIEHAWDRIAGLIEPKSRAGRRRVPVPGRLRSQLAAQRLRARRGRLGFVFSATGERPFEPTNAIRIADRAWERAGLSRITLHECRHTYAAFMIAAGVNAKALSAYMGHSSITVTLDRYGHLLPGNERQAAELLEGFLAGAERPAHAGARAGG